MRILVVVYFSLLSTVVFPQVADSALSKSEVASVKHQKTKPDYVITKQGDLLEGKIVEEVPGQYVKLLMVDGTTREIASKDIRNIKYGTREIRTGGVKRSEFVERHRKVGIGLTTAGAILTGIGTIMIIANPANITPYKAPGTAGVRFSNVAAVGFVFDLAGIPMLIVGAVKLARANRQ